MDVDTPEHAATILSLDLNTLTKDAITTAHRALLLINHPDKNPPKKKKKYTKLTQRINRARDILIAHLERPNTTAATAPAHAPTPQPPNPHTIIDITYGHTTTLDNLLNTATKDTRGQGYVIAALRAIKLDLRAIAKQATLSKDTKAKLYARQKTLVQHYPHAKLPPLHSHSFTTHDFLLAELTVQHPFPNNPKNTIATIILLVNRHLHRIFPHIIKSLAHPQDAIWYTPPPYTTIFAYANLVKANRTGSLAIIKALATVAAHTCNSLL